MKRSRSEVIEEIEKFLNGKGGAYDWDDFVTLRIRDSKLDAIRIECCELRDKYPPEGKRQYCSDEGLARLRQILNQLRMEAGG